MNRATFINEEVRLTPAINLFGFGIGDRFTCKWRHFDNSIMFKGRVFELEWDYPRWLMTDVNLPEGARYDISINSRKAMESKEGFLKGWEPINAQD